MMKLCNYCERVLFTKHLNKLFHAHEICTIIRRTLLRRLRTFKEVLWVSAGQLASKLKAVKVGGLKKILPTGPP